jgi:hypothetical protein
MCHQSKVSCRPTPFFVLALRGTTVCESTAAGVNLVLWCAVVGMAVCHVISFWMFKALTSVKPGVWGCVQERAQWYWYTEEDAHIRPGHHWLCEFGDAGNGTSEQQVVRISSISIIASARIIAAHTSTIKTLLSSSSVGS